MATANTTNTLISSALSTQATLIQTQSQLIASLQSTLTVVTGGEFTAEPPRPTTALPNNAYVGNLSYIGINSAFAADYSTISTYATITRDVYIASAGPVLTALSLGSLQLLNGTLAIASNAQLASLVLSTLTFVSDTLRIQKTLDCRLLSFHSSCLLAAM